MEQECSNWVDELLEAPSFSEKRSRGEKMQTSFFNSAWEFPQKLEHKKSTIAIDYNVTFPQPTAARHHFSFFSFAKRKKRR
tara:strand:+ start:739 stop:981 length:243 start_codon:yes stop_codon:yes gene_type:complete